MKKIKLSIFVLLASVGSIFSQVNISVLAPASNSGSQLRAPNGTSQHKFVRSCSLIKPTEMAATGIGVLTSSVINSIGFSLIDGAGPSQSVGNFTLYLKNTNDVTYNLGANFLPAITGMITCFNGVMTIPTSAAASTINFNSVPGFSYTGGGLYVAFAWNETSPMTNTNGDPATYDASNIGAGNGLGFTGYAATQVAAETMTVSDFRPCYLFTAANTATNEIGVSGISAMGKVSKLSGGAQLITALVKNSSIGIKTNLVVALGISGANTFADSKTITTLAAGATTILTFSPFTATASGINNMSVSILPDQNLANNLTVWSQSVTCTDVAIPPIVLTASNFTSNANGAGGNAAGIIYAFKYTTGPSSSSLSSVSCVIPSFANAANLGKTLYPVLCDATTGNIIASGSTLTIAGGDMDIVKAISFPIAPALMPNTDYLFGLAMPANAYFPIGNSPAMGIVGYYQVPIVGGAPTPINYGYLSLEASLKFASLSLSATASKTLICKGSSLTLTATGATTYTWNSISALVNSTNGVASVTPVIGGTSGAVNYTVNGTDGLSGCKSNKAVITISVSSSFPPCISPAGISLNGVDEYILNLYPNPAVDGKTTVSGLIGFNTILVYNMLGQLVYTKITSQESELIDFQNQPKGNYLIKITNSNKEFKSFKIINQN